MSNDYLTPEISQRICTHMNDDHKDALSGYARFYGGVLNPVEVEMVSISSKSMKLLVDGRNLEIDFDHILQDRHDAHQTLISMMKKAIK